MKKIGVFVILFLLVFNFGLISSDSLGGVQDQVEGLNDQIDGIRDYGDATKWEYLSQEWKEIFLKNPVISFLDNLFRKLNFVFVFLFAENYRISLTLFFVIVIWSCFFSIYYSIFKDYSSFSPNIALVVAFALTVISAQIRVYSSLANVIFKLIFYKEGGWPWIWTGLMFVLFVLTVTAVKMGGKTFAKRREAMMKAQADFDRKILHLEAKNFRRAGEGFR